MSDTDPTPWSEGGGPPGWEQLVADEGGAPPFPVHTRARVRVELRRAIRPPRAPLIKRWVAPTVVATSVVVAAVVIWRFTVHEPAPVAPLEPTVEDVLDEAVGAAGPGASRPAAALAERPDDPPVEDPSEPAPSEPELERTRRAPRRPAEASTTAPAVPVGSPDRSRDVSETGQLIVSSMPSARLFLDGEPIGVTPFRGAVPAGDHALEFRTAAGEVHRTSLHIEPGETTRIVRQLSVAPRSGAPPLNPFGDERAPREPTPDVEEGDDSRRVWWE